MGGGVVEYAPRLQGKGRIHGPPKRQPVNVDGVRVGSMDVRPGAEGRETAVPERGAYRLPVYWAAASSTSESSWEAASEAPINPAKRG